MNYKNHVERRGKGKLSSQFERDYFDYLKYSGKQRLIASHVHDCLKWASQILNQDLLNGKNKTALDVGCAFGYGVGLMRSLGYEAWGTDISRHALMQGKKKLNENVFVVCDSQQGLPFNKEFDLITCFEVLEHLKNPANALQNLYDACDGIVLCTTPNRSVEKIMKKLIRGYDKTHINVKTPLEWEELIRKTLECRFLAIECFVDSSFQVGNTSFYKSLKLPFGMETRIIIAK